MIAVLSQIVVVLAAMLIIVLAVEIIGALEPGRQWGAFGLWSALALVSLAVAVDGRDMPPHLALLLLALALMLWRQRGRLVWAAEHGGAP